MFLLLADSANSPSNFQQTSASGKSRPVAVLGDRQVWGTQKCKDSRLRALVFDDILLQITRVSEWERAPD